MSDQWNNFLSNLTEKDQAKEKASDELRARMNAASNNVILFGNDETSASSFLSHFENKSRARELFVKIENLSKKKEGHRE